MDVLHVPAGLAWRRYFPVQLTCRVFMNAAFLRGWGVGDTYRVTA